MRLKQICNHPAQMLGHGEYDPKQAASFSVWASCARRWPSVRRRRLSSTQFREVAEPWRGFLEGIFGRPGLCLHGGTVVAKRRELVEAFQRENGPPFFVPVGEAGGTGLNLTAASQVVHFDRWWNPAVEDQATDRAFRIGQKKKRARPQVRLRGTVEEQIDALIAEKVDLMRGVIEGGERLLTEMATTSYWRFGPPWT